MARRPNSVPILLSYAAVTPLLPLSYSLIPILIHVGVSSLPYSPPISFAGVVWSAWWIFTAITSFTSSNGALIIALSLLAVQQGCWWLCHFPVLDKKTQLQTTGLRLRPGSIIEILARSMADASMLSASVIIGFAIALILNAPLSFPLLLPVTACLVYYVGQPAGAPAQPLALFQSLVSSASLFSIHGFKLFTSTQGLCEFFAVLALCAVAALWILERGQTEKITPAMLRGNVVDVESFDSWIDSLSIEFLLRAVFKHIMIGLAVHGAIVYPYYHIGRSFSNHDVHAEDETSRWTSWGLSSLTSSLGLLGNAEKAAAGASIGHGVLSSVLIHFSAQTVLVAWNCVLAVYRHRARGIDTANSILRWAAAGFGGVGVAMWEMSLGASMFRGVVAGGVGFLAAWATTAHHFERAFALSLSIAAGGLGIGGAALASTLDLSPEEGFQGISPGAIGWPSILAAGLALSSGAAAVLAEKPAEDEARPSSREAPRDSSMPMKFLGGTKLFMDALYSRLVTAFKGDMLVDEQSASLSDRETTARSAAGHGDAEDWLLGAAWVRMSSNIGYMLVPLFYLAVTIASASSEGVLLTQSKEACPTWVVLTTTGALLIAGLWSLLLFVRDFSNHSSTWRNPRATVNDLLGSSQATNNISTAMMVARLVLLQLGVMIAVGKVWLAVPTIRDMVSSLPSDGATFGLKGFLAVASISTGLIVSCCAIAPIAAAALDFPIFASPLIAFLANLYWQGFFWILGIVVPGVRGSSNLMLLSVAEMFGMRGASDVALLMPLAASGVGFLISVMYSKPSFLFFLTTSLASAWITLTTSHSVFATVLVATASLCAAVLCQQSMRMEVPITPVTGACALMGAVMPTMFLYGSLGGSLAATIASMAVGGTAGWITGALGSLTVVGFKWTKMLRRDGGSASAVDDVDAHRQRGIASTLNASLGAVNATHYHLALLAVTAGVLLFGCFGNMEARMDMEPSGAFYDLGVDGPGDKSYMEYWDSSAEHIEVVDSSEEQSRQVLSPLAALVAVTACAHGVVLLAARLHLRSVSMSIPQLIDEKVLLPSYISAFLCLMLLLFRTASAPISTILFPAAALAFLLPPLRESYGLTRDNFAHVIISFLRYPSGGPLIITATILLLHAGVQCCLSLLGQSRIPFPEGVLGMIITVVLSAIVLERAKDAYDIVSRPEESMLMGSSSPRSQDPKVMGASFSHFILTFMLMLLSMGLEYGSLQQAASVTLLCLLLGGVTSEMNEWRWAE